MHDRTIGDVWKVRVVKSYPEAHNHLLIGSVIGRDQTCIEMNCRSFHFGRLVNGLKDVHSGAFGVRMVPWSRVEVINVLPQSFDVDEATLSLTRDGEVVLTNREHTCPIITNREPRH